ncbi:MAG: glycosyltransferase family 2 protein [Bacteroidota bacterium]
MIDLAKISVIVPNFNHATYLRQRLESIFNQTYSNFEVILLDDCSTDGSVEILEEFAKHEKVTHFICNDHNSGSTFLQWKKGIELAIGEFIWIAESDDFARLDLLEHLIPHFLNPNISLVNCRCELISSGGHILSIKHEKDRGERSCLLDGNYEIMNNLTIHNTIVNASGTIFRKSVLDGIDFPKDYQFSGDWYINIEMLKGRQFYYCGEKLNFYRINQQGVTFKKRDLATEKRRYTEYIHTIKSAFRVLNQQVKFSPIKHSWLSSEWYNLSQYFGNQYAYYLPPLPFILSIQFYYLLIKNGLINLFRR